MHSETKRSAIWKPMKWTLKTFINQSLNFIEWLLGYMWLWSRTIKVWNFSSEWVKIKWKKFILFRVRRNSFQISTQSITSQLSNFLQDIDRKGLCTFLIRPLQNCTFFQVSFSIGNVFADTINSNKSINLTSINSRSDHNISHERGHSCIPESRGDFQNVCSYFWS